MVTIYFLVILKLKSAVWACNTTLTTTKRMFAWLCCVYNTIRYTISFQYVVNASTHYMRSHTAFISTSGTAGQRDNLRQWAQTAAHLRSQTTWSSRAKAPSQRLARGGGGWGLGVPGPSWGSFYSWMSTWVKSIAFSLHPSGLTAGYGYRAAAVLLSDAKMWCQQVWRWGLKL